MSDTNSRNTLSGLKDRNVDSIPLRINFIKHLLNEKKIKPIVNYDITDTENFIKKESNNKSLNIMDNIDENEDNSNNNDEDEDNGSYDTRYSLDKKILNFNETITQIGGKLLYIKSGSTGHTFKGIIDQNNDDLSYAVKVVAYPKKENYGDIYDVRRPENAELMMIKLLSYFVVKKQTPHIILPLATFYTSIKPFVNLIKDDIVDEENKKYYEFIEKYKNNEYHDEVSILISEWATRGDFLDYVRKHYKNFKLIHWKVFFFQIISTLAVIQSKYPSFRHNDLKANNILVSKMTKKGGTMSVYKISNNEYTVPNIGYQIKFWDFDFACIPGIIDNSKVSSEWTKQINVIPERNRYYDMHYFFNTFIKKGFFSQFMEDPIVPQEAKDFVNRIVPKKFQNESKYVHKRGRILIKDEYLIPNNVIKTDPFFEDFRKDKIKEKERENREIENEKEKKNEQIKEPNSGSNKENKYIVNKQNRNSGSVMSSPPQKRRSRTYDFSNLVSLDDLLTNNE